MLESTDLTYSVAACAKKGTISFPIYSLAPFDTCKITGEPISAHASTIAFNCSKLLKLNAGTE